ncbi:hypothetical protein AB0H82_03065 [Streptomyces sp. NPDC050732]|uniref:hypothetical protein n=1 Tax=Streptomyces sp. NPDC050732 TaxID=3154632 RepID=UPI0034373DF0
MIYSISATRQREGVSSVQVSWVIRRPVLLRPVLLVAALCAVLAAAFPGLVSYAADAPPRHPVTSVDETSRAGSRPGEGRERPGRAQPLPPDLPPRPYSPPRIPPPPQQPMPTPAAHRNSAWEPTGQPPAGPVLPNLRVLPLGAGLVLIGLGLGFLGLRLRRG